MDSGLISALAELQEIEEILGDTYRSKAYRKAIAELRKLKNIEDLKKKIPSIGKGILSKITEFMKTGKIKELEKLRKSPIVMAHRELGKILGVGPSTVNKWLQMGINSIAKLRRAIANKKVTLNKMQKYGLCYYADLNERIPRAEVAALGEYIKRLLLQINPNVLFEIAGSFRRLESTSGDIDILVSSSHFDENLLPSLLEILRHDPNFIDALSAGTERITFLYKSPISGKVRQLDILNIPYESYYAALLYFTGSAEFNESIRGYAKRKGYRLNQAGLFIRRDKKLELVPVQSEKEIFDVLGLNYVPPAERKILVLD